MKSIEMDIDTIQEIDLIVFDLDGTLVDSRLDIAISVNHMLGSMGFAKKSYEEIVSLIGRGVKELIGDSLGDNNHERFDEGLSIFREHYLKHFLDNTYLYPHVKDVLEYFKSKKKVIITNKNKDVTLSTIDALGIDKYFDAIVGGDKENYLKPDPHYIIKCLKDFGIENERAIMVGDMYIDVQTGKNAKITTCAVTYGIGKREDFVKYNPDYIINDMIELKDIIK